MALVRMQEEWSPFRELEELSTRFNRLFGMGRGEREELALGDWRPTCDVSETDTEYRVLAELPNVKKEDVKVMLEEGLLSIRGERKAQKEEKGETYHRREVSYGTFLRRFRLPEDADPSKVDASYENGVLKVVVAKSAPKESKAHEVTVH
jgi:HSP20 family protein